MKINADVVLKARKQKSWSQEELAIASGLNLRTIQRIEREASASLQSKKALASGTAQLTGTLQYQACDDKVCYAPTKVPVTWSTPTSAIRC